MTQIYKTPPVSENGILTINEIGPDGSGNFSLSSSDSSITITPSGDGLDLIVANPSPPFIASGNLVYVDANSGSDTTGTGSAINPYQTVAKANSVITTNSSTNPFCIFISGNVVESSMVLKPWVSLVGSSQNTAVTVSGGLSLDSSWTNAGGSSAIFNLNLSGTNLSLSHSNSGGSTLSISIVDCTTGNISTVGSQHVVDNYTIRNCSFGALSMQDASGQIYSSAFTSAACSSVAATTGNTLRIEGGFLTSNITINETSGQTYAVTARASNISGSVTVTNTLSSFSYDALSYPVGGISLVSGGTATPVILNPLNGGTGVNNGTHTLTLAGNLATSGAFNSTFTMTGATGVTFPTSGTLATTSQLPSLPLSLANGGTNASITATAGGVIYSTASTLAPTAAGTSGQLLQSAGTSVPAWTTATYPSAIAINDFLYASSANVITGLATANNATILTNSSGIPSVTALGNSKLVATNASGTIAARSLTLNIQTFTGSGTYTPTTGMLYCIVEMVGGGGSGGGTASTTASQFASASGGSGGEYARAIATAAQIGASQTVTVGTGGAAPTAGANNGNNGVTTSLGTLLTAAGGVGGNGRGATTTGESTAGVNGGSGGGGTLSPIVRIAGMASGQGSCVAAAVVVWGGYGGNSVLGMGGGSPVSGAGASGTGFGSGGSGSSAATSASAFAGGAGANGIVVITEFIIN